MSPTPTEPPSPDAQADRLQAEITDLRQELGGVVAELDRRRREALDLPLQLRRHAQGLVWVALGAGVLLLGLSGGYALYVRRHPLRAPRRRVRRARRQAGRARLAARRALAHPERVAGGEQHMLVKVATAGLTALASATAKRLVERGLRPGGRGGASESGPRGAPAVPTSPMSPMSPTSRRH